MEESSSSKKMVCVTGGTGYLASWLIFKLLEKGYHVNTTVRSSPDHEKAISYLRDLPGAAERLQVFFNAHLSKSSSFNSAIEGCTGVFHVAHPMDLDGLETEEEKTKKAIDGALGILGACLDSKTVKRVVYTASAACLICDSKGQEDTVDESTWSDIDYIRSLGMHGYVYAITKTLTEKACLEFAEKQGLDLVTVLPTMVHGSFITPNLPSSVRHSMSMILRDREPWNVMTYSFVHIDDVARAHIFLLEYPAAEGRYICNALDITAEDLGRFLVSKYPEFRLPSPDPLKEDMERLKFAAVSCKKLLGTGFKYEYGLDEMFDDAIRCCKEKGLLL